MVTSHPPWDLCTTVRLQEAGIQSWDLDSAIALAPWFLGGSILGGFTGNLLLTCNLGRSFGWGVCACVMILVSSCRYCSILICCLF